MKLVVALLLLLLPLLAACAPAVQQQQPPSRPSRPENVATRAQVRAEADAFGIRNLKATRAGGTIWTSDWRTARSFDGVDPQDPWFDAGHGEGSFEVSNGRLKISGQTPRMYIYDPQRRRQWRDVEITTYARRVSDDAVPYAGMTAVARANHLKTENGIADLCDTRGYGARLRYDGHADFEKETAHPQNTAIANVKAFPRGMPSEQWIGYKYLVYDRPDGVHLELWVDRTDGRDGGQWQLVTSVVDDGTLFGREACAEGVDPALALTHSPNRIGSESGKPNLTVYFRSDGVDRNGLVYKWTSVREITAN